MDRLLHQRLEQRRQTGTFRRLTINSTLVDFVSNDYLGFARSASLAQQVMLWQQQAGTWGIGSTGSRLLSGHSLLAERLEQQIACFHGTEAALLFNSGYDANLGVLSALLREGDTVLYDEYVHASMRDGIHLGHARSFPFRHNDVDHLESRLQRIQKGESAIWIAIETLYSMEGDCAPVEKISDLADRYQAFLIVDEAHATGVLGTRGEGLTQSLNLGAQVPVRIHTFGKALGCHGAVAVGSQALRDTLINFARPLIYSTALPPHSLFAIKAAYEALPHATEQRRALKERIQVFRAEAEKRQFSGLLANDGPIQILILENSKAAKQAAVRMQAAGFDVRAICSPTVPRGRERLRICLHAFNTVTEVRDLVGALEGARQ